MTVVCVSRLSRRMVLTSAAALGLEPILGHTPASAAARPASPLTLEASAGVARLSGANQPATTIWGYNGRLPGPVLRVAQGDEVFVRFRNGLAVPSTIHFHGLRNVNAMDGVAHLTQHPVRPGRVFDYRFVCPDAGTFWYHPHMHEPEQLARGLCGILIVDEPLPPQVDQDLALLIQDWRLDATGQIETTSFGSRDEQARDGRLGQLQTVNGLRMPDFPVRAGERLRIRLVNAANARVLQLLFKGSAPKIIAIDGQPIPPREAYAGGLDLPPGGRMDLILDVLGPPGGVIELSERSLSDQTLARFVLHPWERAREAPLIAPMTQAPNPVPPPDLSDVVAVDLVMTGGAQRDDVTRSENVAKHGHANTAPWAFNGVAGLLSRSGDHGRPLFSTAHGRTVAIHMVNNTLWQHAMHIHGHHFKVVSRTIGQVDPYWWDTLLMAPSEAVTIAFVADNPGRWMLHCHMLEHQAGGMFGWFAVV